MRFVLPSAVRRVFPRYLNDLIELTKSTSIVGYIAVQDLTKVSDIVRSRTYQAFFPLLSTAAQYFLLAWLLTGLIGRAAELIDETESDPQKVLEKLKGKQSS